MANSFDIQKYFKEGWELFTANIVNFIVAAIIFVVVHFAANLIPFAGILVAGPMLGGLYYIILDGRDGVAFNAIRIFDGFRLKFVPLVLIGVLTTIFSALGFILLILPGILIVGWYLFTYLFAVDKNMDFWEAMEASRKIGFENHINVFLLALLLMILNFLGMLALGVGLLATMPLSLCIVLKAYEDLTGAKAGSQSTTPPPPPPPATPNEPGR